MSLAILFIFALAATLAANIWLGLRQLAALRSPRVPDFLAEGTDPDSIARAGAYTTAKVRLDLIHRVFGAAVAVALTLGGGVALLAGIAPWEASPILDGLALFGLLALLLTLLDLPFAAWKIFGIEAEYGFNRVTPGLFATDKLKELLLVLVLGAPLAAAVLALILYSGSWWWLWAWGVWVAFNLLMMVIFPTVIMPLFNKFTPLEDESLRNRLDHLLADCGFASSGMFIMDGSTRSSHGNAFFTGLGRSKRIVFFDTLLGRLGHEEIAAVLAHELGHFRLKHLRNRLLLSFAASLALFAGMAWMLEAPWYYQGLHLPEGNIAAGLAGFVLVLPYFLSPLLPLTNYLSRRAEFAADGFAVRHAGRDDLIGALIKLYRDNAAPLVPDPYYAAVFESHPPAHQRIRRLKETPC